jgi:hypothetical protein
MIRICRWVLGLLVLTAALACAAGEAPVPGLPVNVVVEVSSDLARAAAYRLKVEPEKVVDCILSADVRGYGLSFSAVGVEFCPDDDKASLELVVNGRLDTRTSSTKGPAITFNNGQTIFQARKPVWLTAEGLSWAPAHGDACTDLLLLGVRTDLPRCLDPIGRWYARRVYYRDEPQARSIVAGKTARRVEARFDREAGEQLAEQNQSFQEQLARLRQENLLPRPLLFRTSHEFLGAAGRLADEDRPPQLTPLPPLRGIPAVSLRLHESAVNTAARRRYAGKTLSTEELKEQWQGGGLFGATETKFRVKYPEPKGGRPREEQRPFTVRFVDRDPLDLSFRDDRIRVSISTAELTSEEEQTSQAWRTSATYRISRTAQGLLLVREGNLDIRLYSRPDARVPGTLFAERTLIGRSFDRFLPAEVEVGEVVLPDDLKKVGTLQTTQVEALAGWLVLAWKRVPAAGTVAPGP